MITEEKVSEEMKKERRRICPLLSLNSPRGEVECLKENCEWFDTFEERCVIYNLKWTTKAIESIASLIEKLIEKGE